MVRINKDISINLNKLLNFVFPQKEKYVNEKIMFYLRLYTDLIKAEEKLSIDGFKKMLNLLKVIRNMSKEAGFKEEEAYIRRINQIANSLIKNANEIRKAIRKDPTSDAYHAKTKLQLAQNICILRILKRDVK
ncbi:hypothetical protein GF323_02930 [Candidatus Woesearchaeota archaeon]|nr:hypothetical protein [Candidatus Woesearchaeota archaeon]